MQAQASPITVVIPTYNRCRALLTCLDHLERQTWTNFDTIVVDDGSTDGTTELLRRYLVSTPLRIRYLRQNNGGPAKARNLAIANSNAPVCVMIGDDIFCDPDFVGVHLRFHREHPERNIAGLGLTEWSRSGQTVTRFMRWLDEEQLQFSYRTLLEGRQPGWAEFFTSNLSLKTELLRENPFDERFPKAAMEDIELGYRLAKLHDLKVQFLPEARAEHLHPTTFAQSAQRLVGVGEATWLFHQLWPEHKPQMPHGLYSRLTGWLRKSRWFLGLLTRFTDLLSRFWCPGALLRRVLTLHASAGYHSESLRLNPRPTAQSRGCPTPQA